MSGQNSGRTLSGRDRSCEKCRSDRPNFVRTKSLSVRTCPNLGEKVWTTPSFTLFSLRPSENFGRTSVRTFSVRPDMIEVAEIFVSSVRNIPDGRLVRPKQLRTVRESPWFLRYRCNQRGIQDHPRHEQTHKEQGDSQTVRSLSGQNPVRPKYFGRTKRRFEQLRSRPDGQEMSGRLSVRKFSHGRNENNVQLRVVQTFSPKFGRVRTDGLFVRTKSGRSERNFDHVRTASDRSDCPDKKLRTVRGSRTVIIRPECWSCWSEHCR